LKYKSRIHLPGLKIAQYLYWNISQSYASHASSTHVCLLKTGGKIITIGERFLAALLFISWWGANSNVIAAESNAAGAKGILLKEEYVPGSYCHQKLSAIRGAAWPGIFRC